MKVEESITQASRFMRSLDERMDGLKIREDIECRVSCALLHLSLEHFGAIVLLIDNKLNGSAAALIRSQ